MPNTQSAAGKNRHEMIESCRANVSERGLQEDMMRVSSGKLPESCLRQAPMTTGLLGHFFPLSSFLCTRLVPPHQHRRLRHGALTVPPSLLISIDIARAAASTPVHPVTGSTAYSHHILHDNIFPRQHDAASGAGGAIHSVHEGTKDVCYFAREIQSRHVNG